jgi:hypothetical protein
MAAQCVRQLEEPGVFGVGGSTEAGNVLADLGKGNGAAAGVDESKDLLGEFLRGHGGTLRSLAQHLIISDLVVQHGSLVAVQEVPRGGLVSHDVHQAEPSRLDRHA